MTFVTLAWLEVGRDPHGDVDVREWARLTARLGADKGGRHDPGLIERVRQTSARRLVDPRNDSLLASLGHVHMMACLTTAAGAGGARPRQVYCPAAMRLRAVRTSVAEPVGGAQRGRP